MTDAFEQLVAAGKARGYVSVEEVSRLLSVENVPSEQLAELIYRLEQHGIEVEVDPAVLRPRSSSAHAISQSQFALPEGTSVAEPVRGTPSESSASSSSGSPPNKARDMHFALKAAALVFVVALAAMIIIFWI